MASTPVITSPADNSSQALPFTLAGTGDIGSLVEVRDDSGWLLPATANPVTVNGSGDWSIYVTALTGSGTGNKGYTATGGTVYVSAGAVIESGFPVIAEQNGVGYQTTIVSPTFSTAGASMIVVVFAGNQGGSTALFDVTPSGGGLTYTRVQDQRQGAGTQNGLCIWYAWSSAALTSQAVTVTFANNANALTNHLSVFSCTGASSTIGVSNGAMDAGVTLTQQNVTLTGVSANSLVIGGFSTAALSLPTVVTDTTQDDGFIAGTERSSSVFHHAAASAGNPNVGYSGTAYWVNVAAVEVMAA